MARSPLVIGPFSRGLNTYDDATAVLDDELVEALNFDPGLEGSLKSRPPFEDLGKPLTLGATGNPRILGVYYATNGAPTLIASDGLTSTWTFDGSAWALLTNTFAASSMAQFDGKAWLTSPVGEADPGGYWTPGGGFVADADMPHGDMVVSYKFRLWVIPGKNQTNGTRLYYSKVLGQASFWASPGFVDIGAGDGQSIVSVVTWYNTLLVFRTQSIYSFEYATDPAQGIVQVVVPGIGLETKECLVSHESYLYFMYDEKAYEFINNRAQQINVKVPFSATSTSDVAYPFTVSKFNNRVIFSYFNTLYVFSLRTRTWTRWRSDVHGAIGQFVSPSTAGTIDEAYVFPSASVPSGGVLNLSSNPSFQVNTSGWGASTGAASLTRLTSVPGSAHCASWTSTVTGTLSQARANNIAITPGSSLSVAMKMRKQGATARSARVVVSYYDATGTPGGADGVQIGSEVVGATASITDAGWTTLTLQNLTVPLGTAYFRYYARVESAVTGEEYYVDETIPTPTASASTYFDGNTSGASWLGTAGLSQSRLRFANLLYMTDSLTDASEPFQCILQTKNYSYKLASNFKRLYWWGVDAIFKEDIKAEAIPVAYDRRPTWGELRTAGATWGSVRSAGGTWRRPYTGLVSVTSDYDFAGLGSERKFVKFRKGLRFRQIGFRLTFDTDGSFTTAPVQVFTLSAYIDTKETVVKTVS